MSSPEYYLIPLFDFLMLLLYIMLHLFYDGYFSLQESSPGAVHAKEKYLMILWPMNKLVWMKVLQPHKITTIVLELVSI